MQWKASLGLNGQIGAKTNTDAALVVAEYATKTCRKTHGALFEKSIFRKKLLISKLFLIGKSELEKVEIESSYPKSLSLILSDSPGRI